MNLTRAALIVALAAAPGSALAQDQGSGEATSESADPAAADAWLTEDPARVLEGLWRVDEAEVGTAEDPAIGKIISISRNAVAGIASGTCTNPTFGRGIVVPEGGDPAQRQVEIFCVGEKLATIRWPDGTPSAPQAIQWSEPDIDIVLHRIAAAPPPASDGAAVSPESGDAGGDTGGDPGSDAESTEGSEGAE